MAGDDWEYQIRHRAYELWNAAGRPDGKHQQFWEAAERELKRMDAASVKNDRTDGDEAATNEGTTGPTANGATRPE